MLNGGKDDAREEEISFKIGPKAGDNKHGNGSGNVKFNPRTGPAAFLTMGLIFPIIGLTILILDLVVGAHNREVQLMDQAQNNKRGDHGVNIVVNQGTRKIHVRIYMENQ